MRSFLISCVIFGVAVVLLVTHAQTGLTVSSWMSGSSLFQTWIQARAPLASAILA